MPDPYAPRIFLPEKKENPGFLPYLIQKGGSRTPPRPEKEGRRHAAAKKMGLQEEYYDRLHRAQDLDTGAWVEGWLYIGPPGKSGIHIMDSTGSTPGSMQAYKVDPDTLCRCSGFRDAGGQMLWENDTVEKAGGGNKGVVRHGKHDGTHYGFYIDWDDPWLRKDLLYWDGKINKH